MIPLKLWVGLECTHNRVGEHFHNQLEKNGHNQRETDIEMFARLGADRIRYPCLWDSVCVDSPNNFDWSLPDKKLSGLKKSGLTPIIGLLHHGSGPRFTSLIDPKFPELFASYAHEFAQRFPWVEDFTPINEIVTTACFSCLYGHWYPHKKNDADFVHAVFNQVKATVLAMQEIRKIQPRARLIQTEDMGRTQSTDILSYQADFQNQRRWLSFDMLCGKIDCTHSMYDYLIRSGLSAQQLKWLQHNSCAPDVLGINHYLLSNRYLDHQLELYPAWSHGGNGIHAYADVGAIEIKEITSPSPSSVLMDVWERYQLPIAVTEVQICGQRESQLRWLHQIWHDCENLRIEGVNIQAVTAWSLLGSYDWNSLCTIDHNFYEAGVYDLRSANKSPKDTIVSKWIEKTSRDEKFDHPILDQPGWWQPKNYQVGKVGKIRRLLITGGRGTLATAFARICEKRGIAYHILDRSLLDIGDLKQVNTILNDISPWAVINAAGYVNVDNAELEKERCYRENVVGAKNLALWCALNKASLITFSSDLVFDGNFDKPYREGDIISPLNTYGHSKAQCEKSVLEICPSAMIVRTGAFFGPWDQANFLTRTLQSVSRDLTVNVAEDLVVSPTYVPDLVNTTLDLLIDGETGTMHLANQGALTWADFARRAVEEGQMHLPSKNKDVLKSLLVNTSEQNMQYRARRPKNSALASDRISILPSIENALGRYFNELEIPLN